MRNSLSLHVGLADAAIQLTRWYRIYGRTGLLRLWLAMTTLFLLSASAYALTDGSPLPAPALETRAQELFREIRCVVCAGQSIHDSGALVAHDMRALIRSQIEAGKSDTEIKHFLIERYGDEILMTPPLSPRTALLWLAPLVFLALGILITFALMRRRKHQANI